ncbi:PH domain-containing protein [bacterium]|nr:PH domain-containing protein [bacterium]
MRRTNKSCYKANFVISYIMAKKVEKKKNKSEEIIVEKEAADYPKIGLRDKLCIQRKTLFFDPFPEKLRFAGEEKEEDIVLVIRTHWMSQSSYILLSIGLLILPFILSKLFASAEVSFKFGLFVLCFLLSVSSLMYGFLKWYYNVNIITNKRVIDCDFLSLFTSEISEARLDKIEDITSKQAGVIKSLFDIGSVYIQTAGAKAEIEFDNISNPKLVRDILNNLLEELDVKKNDK